MYVRNLDNHPVLEKQYHGLKRDDKYWFPHACKYFVWFLVFAVVIVSSVILIYYGMAFGMMKTYLWLTSVISSFLLGVFIIAPVRIIAFSLFDALFIKRKPVFVSRIIVPSLLENAEDPERKQQVERARRYHQHLYTPTPVSKLQTRLEDIKYNIELRNLTVDVFVYIFFMATVFYVVLINKTEMGYYSTQTVKNLVVNGGYTNSVPFTEVKTYETFLEYLNETFLPALLLDYKTADKVKGVLTDRDNPVRRRGRSHEFLGARNSSKLRKERILNLFREIQSNQEDQNKTNVFQRGWTMDPAVKLIGKPRLRQIRVRSGSCEEMLMLEGRNIECVGELTLWNEEVGIFTLEWAPYHPKGLTASEKTPWIHQTGWETGTLPIVAKFSSYPPGGYVLDLAKNLDDARIVLEYLDAFQWVDTRTRAIFLEFTTYCVNANLFNVVTLIAEKSATGYIIPSYQVATCKLMFMVVEVEIIFIIMSMLFALLLFFLLLREGLRIHRTSFKLYLKRAFAVLDLTLLFFGMTSVVFIVLRSIYVRHLLDKLEKSPNNEFVSFDLAAFWDMCSIYIEAILICLASFKLFRLLTFKVLFFQLQTCLTHCYKHFVHLVLQVLMLTVAFALLFHLTLMAYAYGFSSFALSLSTMAGRSVAMDDTFDFSVLAASSISPLFFGLFVVFVTFLFVNLFIAVICLYFHQIRRVSLTEKYSLARYLKHVLTASRRKDILHLKDGKEESVLRLRGGGSGTSKKRRGKKKDAGMRKRDEEKEERRMIDVSQFVLRRPYDVTRYRGLSGDCEAAMRFLTVSLLTEEAEVRDRAREGAMKALFLIFTSRRKMDDAESPDKYFTVVARSSKTVFDQRQLLNMKEVVEEYAKKNNWVTLESSAVTSSDVCRPKNVRILNEKLESLLKLRK